LGLLLAVAPALAGSREGTAPYPDGPDGRLTPGSLCEAPDSFRYPERVKYCERRVESSEKNSIIATYDMELGYAIRQLPRADFKIDHLIPLCAGGSNHRDNLWPQHKSVYTRTDPLEPLLCDAMAKGKLKQAEAMELILNAKQDLSRVPAALDKLKSLVGR